MTYIGIDIGRNSFVAAVIVKEKSRFQKFPNTPGGHERLLKMGGELDKEGEIRWVGVCDGGNLKISSGLCTVMRKLAGIIYAILRIGRPLSEKIYRQISAQFQISSWQKP